MESVLIIIPNDALGGAEQYLKMIAKYFIRNKFHVYVLFLKKEKYLGWSDLRSSSTELFFTDSDSELAGILPLLLNIKKIRKICFNYVFTSHVHLTSLTGILLKFGVIKKRYFIARESTSVFKRYTGFNLYLHHLMYRIGYTRSIDVLICQTNYMMTQLVEALPWLKKRTEIVVLNNPIDLQSIGSDDTFDDLDGRLCLNNYVIAAGRLIDEKGFDLLIHAFKDISIDEPSLKLVVLGEGRERAKLELMIKELDLDERVLLPGHVKDVLPFFKHAAVCVVSSRIEGFPNVLLQMMSQNTQIVATKCAGGIEDIKGIYLAETNSKDSLLLNIKLALDNERLDNEKYFQDFLKDVELESFISKVRRILRYIE